MIIKKTRKAAWCVGERRHTGPDKGFYIPRNFRTAAEAEKERRLAALPEKAGYSLFLAIAPEVRRKPTRRPSSRRTTR